MKTTIGILFFLFTYFYSVSQSNIRSVEELSNSYSENVLIDTRERKLEYSQYITKDWVNGEVLTKSDQHLKDVLLKYEPHKKLVFIKSENLIYTFPFFILKGIKFESDHGKRVFKNMKLEGKEEFLEVLVRGEYSLFIQFETRFVPANYNKLLDHGSINDKIQVSTNYYLMYGQTESMELIPKGKNKIIEYFAAKKDEIKTYQKKENLKFKKNIDYINAVNFLNK